MQRRIFSSLRDSGWQAMDDYYYVYILRSLSKPDQTYVGYTTDLQARLAKHNEGGSPYTSKNKPWQVEVAMAFSDKQKALAFEKYLKSGSGREFSRRHF